MEIARAVGVTDPSSASSVSRHFVFDIIINNIVKRKVTYIGHVMRGSSGLNVLLVLEKFDGEKQEDGPAWLFTSTKTKTKIVVINNVAKQKAT